MRKHDSNMSTSFKFSQNQSLPRNNMQYASICIISHRYSPSKIRQFGSWGPKPWGDFARENGKNLRRSKNIPRTPPVIIPCNDLPFLDICLCSSPYYPNTIISWINHHISIYIYISHMIPSYLQFRTLPGSTMFPNGCPRTRDPDPRVTRLIPTIEAIKAKKDIALANKAPKIQQKIQIWMINGD